jgi:hypothetical protein
LSNEEKTNDYENFEKGMILEWNKPTKIICFAFSPLGAIFRRYAPAYTLYSY